MNSIIIKDEIVKIQLIISENKLKNNYNEETNKITEKNTFIEPKINKDMIGIKYPEIMFDDIKSKIKNNILYLNFWSN